MFRNYLKTAIRNLWRKKGFTAINIAGLAIGIATCLLIMLFVQNQLSYDKFHGKANRIYRITLNGTMNGGQLKEASVMAPVALTLKNDYPEIEQSTRIRNYFRPTISLGEKSFRTENMAFVDANLFQIFTLPLIKGDPNTALAQPNAIVITQAVAKKYFDNQNPIGKILTLEGNEKVPLTITGIMEEIPENSHFHFTILGSLSTIPDSKSDSWMVSDYFTYILLQKGADPAKLQAKLPQTIDKYLGPQLQQGMGVTMQQFKENGNKLDLILQPITDIHLHSDLTGDMEPYGDIRYVYIFSAVAIFMLLIACINFMNLSTAGAAKRAKEVGIRKVLGSEKSQLIRQFMLESFLLTTISLLLSLVLVYTALPIFNSLANQNLSINIFTNPWMLPTLILFGLITGILAGSYPAFYLSSFNPVRVLKGRFAGSKTSSGFRSALVVFQFIISISLIVGTTVVYNQLSFLKNKKLGYNKDQVLIIEDTYWLGNNRNAFQQELTADPRIVSISGSGYLPAGNTYSNNYFAYADNKSSELIKSLRYEIDYHYLNTLGIEMAAGRNFSRDFGADSTAIIINESAAKAFGWKDNPVGHSIGHNDNDGSKQTYQVIGVVKDFHFKSLREKITPLVMTLGFNNNNLIIKTKAKDVAPLIASIKKSWDQYKSKEALTYSFLDERYFNTYKAEQTIGTILGIFSGLTIFVACLGLFGLATFTAEQRTKEIGVRKVLGADTLKIVALLSKDFIKLVVISFIIATPIAWFVMNKWLQDFEYRTKIDWWIFALAGILAISITMITVSFQAIKAAFANPTKSLRSE